ncbi:MAG: hypothetical protein J5I90_22085 [Caldilineales bacterium]|nr:hypothetical protein [Caldilineales bacterium]
MRRTFILMTGLLLFAILANPAHAQTPTTADPLANGWMGRVTGTVENQTVGGAVPAELVVMLHAWDDNFDEKLMRDAPIEVDGSFVFEDVPFSTALTYGIMAAYNNVPYFADPVTVTEGQTEIAVITPIYEMTSDPANIEITRAHIILNPTTQGLQVTEVLSVSNFGDRTLKDAVTLADGQSATLAFSLPEDATVPTFMDSSDRWRLTENGFADTTPLQPGENVAQIVAFYQMGYEDGMTFSYTADYPNQGLTLVIPQESGVEIEGEGLLDAGARTSNDGATLRMFTHKATPAGGAIVFRLTGAPAPASDASTAMSEPFQTSDSSRLILIGSLVLGAALIGLGVALLRRTQRLDQTAGQDDFELDEIFRQIALLDDAHQSGEIDSQIYHERRQSLMEQGRRLLTSGDTPVSHVVARV